jgi:hypothetical protein
LRLAGLAVGDGARESTGPLELQAAQFLDLAVGPRAEARADLEAAEDAVAKAADPEAGPDVDEEAARLGQERLHRHRERLRAPCLGAESGHGRPDRRPQLRRRRRPALAGLELEFHDLAPLHDGMHHPPAAARFEVADLESRAGGALQPCDIELTRRLEQPEGRRRELDLHALLDTERTGSPPG